MPTVGIKGGVSGVWRSLRERDTPVVYRERAPGGGTLKDLGLSLRLPSKKRYLRPARGGGHRDPMKPTAIVVAILAALVAAGGTAGYALVTHGSLPFASAPGGSGGVGTLNVYVTDAPPASQNWSHVYVTFSLVQTHAANDSAWQNISVTQATVDLLGVKTVPAFLGGATLPAGMYTQLRIVVGSAWGVNETGQKFNFTVPSNVLKTTDPFNVTTGETTNLVVDINLSHAIVLTAQGYILTPVIASVQSS
jgi:Domain of unknown function (DUF4382)